MIEKFPDEELYVVNVYDGLFQLYDARDIAKHPTQTKMNKFRDGSRKLKTQYVFPKDIFIAEAKL